MTTVDWIEYLRSFGQRATPARQAVLEVVASTSAHLSADEIASKVSEIAPDVHRATVFRTLDRLHELGIIAHVHFPTAATTYHFREAGERMHLHILCVTCRRIFDADPALLDSAAEALLDTLGFELAVDHAALSGECSECADTE